MSCLFLCRDIKKIYPLLNKLEFFVVKKLDREGVFFYLNSFIISASFSVLWFFKILSCCGSCFWGLATWAWSLLWPGFWSGVLLSCCKSFGAPCEAFSLLETCSESFSILSCMPAFSKIGLAHAFEAIGSSWPSKSTVCFEFWSSVRPS